MVNNLEEIQTLEDFWKNADSVVVDFVNSRGEYIDDMDYPLSTKVNRVRHIEFDRYVVELDVEIHSEEGGE